MLASDRALYPVDRTGHPTGCHELPKTMARPKSRHRDRAKAALVFTCGICLFVPWVVGLIAIAKWVTR